LGYYSLKGSLKDCWLPIGFEVGTFVVGLEVIGFYVGLVGGLLVGQKVCLEGGLLIWLFQ
jgi:hypothetical protein